MQETQVQSLGWKDRLQKEMATHSNILEWRIPWAEEPGSLHSPRGLKESDRTEQLSFPLHINIFQPPLTVIIKVFLNTAFPLGSGRFLGGGNGNPLKYSCLGNPMHRGDWRAILHTVTKSRT